MYEPLTSDDALEATPRPRERTLAGHTKSHIPAGFAAPAADNLDRSLDLHDYVGTRPPSTFFFRATRDATEGNTNPDVHAGDLLVVDRAADPVNGSLVIAAVDGSFVIRRLLKKNGQFSLTDDAETEQALPIDPEQDTRFFGVVTFVIRDVRVRNTNGSRQQ